MTKDCSPAPSCIACRFYRAQTKQKATKFGGEFHITPLEYKEVPTGQGECMLLPPGVHFRQAAADRKETWAGEVTSVVNPGFVQSRPIVLKSDFCASFAEKVR